MQPGSHVPVFIIRRYYTKEKFFFFQRVGAIGACISPSILRIYRKMHSTISLTLFFQWCSRSTPVSLSSERLMMMMMMMMIYISIYGICTASGFFNYFGSFHWTEVVRLYFFIRCKRENSSSQIISDVQSGFETILPRHVGW